MTEFRIGFLSNISLDNGTHFSCSCLLQGANVKKCMFVMEGKAHHIFFFALKGFLLSQFSVICCLLWLSDSSAAISPGKRSARVRLGHASAIVSRAVLAEVDGGRPFLEDSSVQHCCPCRELHLSSGVPSIQQL